MWLNIPLMFDGGLDLCFCELVMGYLWICLAESAPYDYSRCTFAQLKSCRLSLRRTCLNRCLSWFSLQSMWCYSWLLSSSFITFLHLLSLSASAASSSSSRRPSLKPNLPLWLKTCLSTGTNSQLPSTALKGFPQLGCFLLMRLECLLLSALLSKQSPPRVASPSRTSCLARNLCFHRGGK